MEITRYTEYSSNSDLGKVIVQVPTDYDKGMPVQIIIDVGKQVILKLDELIWIQEVVKEALELSDKELMNKNKGAIV